MCTVVGFCNSVKQSCLVEGIAGWLFRARVSCVYEGIRLNVSMHMFL